MATYSAMAWARLLYEDSNAIGPSPKNSRARLGAVKAPPFGRPALRAAAGLDRALCRATDWQRSMALGELAPSMD